MAKVFRSDLPNNKVAVELGPARIDSSGHYSGEGSFQDKLGVIGRLHHHLEPLPANATWDNVAIQRLAITASIGKERVGEVSFVRYTASPNVLSTSQLLNAWVWCANTVSVSSTDRCAVRGEPLGGRWIARAMYKYAYRLGFTLGPSLHLTEGGLSLWRSMDRTLTFKAHRTEHVPVDQNPRLEVPPFVADDETLRRIRAQRFDRRCGWRSWLAPSYFAELLKEQTQRSS